MEICYNMATKQDPEGGTIMTQEAYIELQKQNMDRAIALGKELLRASASLHKVCDTADKDETRRDEAKNYLRDSLMYFSFNNAATELSSMPTTLTDFKQQLIDIKIANDTMLLEGGYRKDIDEVISTIFLSHRLCKVIIIDEPVLDCVREAIEKVQNLKASL